MRVRNSHSRSWIVPVSLAFALLSGCSTSGNGVPDVAEPPPFEYAEGFELRTGMHRLAFALQELDRELRLQEMEEDDFTQEWVVRSLRDIERIATTLREDEMSSSHTFLRGEMANFLDTVNQARVAAERNPPDYYMAGRVSGGCINCHQMR